VEAVEGRLREHGGAAGRGPAAPAGPALLGGGSTLFNEEDLQAAFPRSKNSDAGIDFGELTLLAEVVTGQASLATRESASVTAYAADIEKLFVKKARRLDETAACLLRDPQPDASPLGKPARRILPVTVRGWQFPLNRLTRRHNPDLPPRRPRAQGESTGQDHPGEHQARTLQAPDQLLAFLESL
jgi:hypothetical protein